MELLQLKYFCYAAKSENFSKTAKKFGVPPSDISQSIRRLERELGVLLFVRHANKIVLSEIGNEFSIRVSEALSLLDDAKSIAIDSLKNDKISICINSNRRIVMETLEKFKIENPSVEVCAMHFADPTSEKFDLVVTGDPNGYEGFEGRKLLSESLSLAVCRNHPLSHYETVDVAALARESFVTMTERSTLFDLTRRICEDHGFLPRIAVQSDDPFYVRKCVELGLGIAIVPNFSWQGQFPENVALLPIDNYVRDTFLYIRSRKHISPSVNRFVDMLLAECASESDGE